MSAFVQKKNCKDVLQIQQSDPNNRTIGKVPSCEGNSTTPITSTNSSDGGKVPPLPPDLFPEEGKGKKIETTLTVVDTLNKTKNSSNLDVGQPEPTDAKPDEVKSNSTNLTSTSTNDNAKAGVNSSRVDTEVGDLLKSPIKTLTSNQIPDVPPNVTSNATGNIDTETELIENGDNTEDLRRNSSSNEKLSSPGVPLVQGQLAAILAGVFVVISITAYVGLLSWRRYLENRYGTREMLVNEDEFNDDLRHFSI